MNDTKHAPTPFPWKPGPDTISGTHTPTPWRVVTVAAYVWGARNVYKIERTAGEYASFTGRTYWTSKRAAVTACKAINANVKAAA